MFLKWFDTRAVDGLADKLVREFLHRIPPGSVDAVGKKAVNKQIRTREVVLRDAAEFSRGHRLNVYKKARLANRFKWALLEAGYAKDFVNEISFELAAVMATRKNDPK